MAKSVSVKGNAILNVIRQAINTIVPLLLVPYVTRVLNVAEYGKISFSRSFVSYFIMLAGLGIGTYAIREGAKLRDDREKLNVFVSEIFSINFYMTLISYALLFFFLLIPKFAEYQLMILILSVEIIMNTLGVEWVCSIYEDFIYFTIRTIVIRLLTLFSVFVFVKNESDSLIYCAIIAGTYTLSNIANFIHSKRYVSFRLTLNTNIRKHYIPILILFANTVMITIYTSSDKTILGLMSTDFSVGIYSLASQAYSIIKTVISAMTIVTLARLSYYVGNGEIEKYNSLLKKTIDGIVFIICPAVVGLFCTSKEVIWLLGGNAFLESVGCLKLLSIALLFAVINMIFTTEVLIPFGKEKKVFKCSVYSACINIFLNILLIPFFDYNAAAFTTLIAELFVLVMSMYYSKDIISYNFINKDFTEILFGSFSIVVVCFIIDLLNFTLVFDLFFKILISGAVYLGLMLSLRNKTILNFKGYIRQLIEKRF